MSKATNKAQIEVLVSRMQENADIARGFVKENRGVVAAFWKKLSLELNSAGPPEKNESEWKKVWNDQKRYIRKKASLNRMYERGTGGGPNKTQKFSSTEEAIFELVGIKEAVEGVGNSNAYGLNPPMKITQINTPTVTEEISVCDIIEEFEYSNDFEPNVSAILEESKPATVSTNKKTILSSNESLRKSSKISTSEVVFQELEVQKELCAKVGEMNKSLERIEEQQSLQLQEIKRHNLEMEKSQERTEEQQSQLLQEIKRHNLEMENLKKEEIENAKKLIELKELKLKMMRENTPNK